MPDLDLCKSIIILLKNSFMSPDWLIALGFNETSTLVCHFVSSPREREKRDNTGNEREGQGRKRKMNESEEIEEIKTFLLYPYRLQGQQALPNCKPISVGHPGNARYTTPLPHPTTLKKWNYVHIFINTTQLIQSIFVDFDTIKYV